MNLSSLSGAFPRLLRRCIPGMPASLDRSETPAVLAAAVRFSQEWQRRKVESIHLLGGSHGRRRVSLDVLVPAHPALHYAPDARDTGRGDDIIVPLTFQEKGVLRQFDIHGPDGSPLSVLGRGEDLPLVRGLLRHELEGALLKDLKDTDEDLLMTTLTFIIDGDPGQAQPVADTLGIDGMIDTSKVLDPSALSKWAKRLLTVLPSNYLLIVLVPKDLAGRRVVLKYSLEWSLQPERLALVGRAKAAFGYDDFAFEVELSHPSGAASHHLELVFPDGLEAGELTMPTPSGTGEVLRNVRDSEPLGILHGVERYPQEAGPPGKARITFGPTQGLRQLTFLVLLTTSVILCLGRWLPNAQEALLEANDGAAALLLAVPAVVLALLSREGENAVVSRASSVLRQVVIACALLLLACAGSIVGHLWTWPRLRLWELGGGATGLLAIALLLGISRSQKRRSVSRDDHDGG